MLKILPVAARKVKAEKGKRLLCYTPMSGSCIVELLYYAQLQREKCDLIGINGLNHITNLGIKWVETSFAGRKNNNSLQKEQQWHIKINER